jgi:hypothetical protein
MPSEKIHRLGSRCNHEYCTWVPRQIEINGSSGFRPAGIRARQVPYQELKGQIWSIYFKGKIESYRRGEAAVVGAVIPAASIKTHRSCYLRQ